MAAGSQHGRSHSWQGHAERPDGQGESGLRGSPWIFLNIYPRKPESACFTVLCFPPILLTLTGGCPPTTFFWKKLIQGFSLLHQLKLLWWLSNLPNSWGLFTTCELFTAPQPQEAQSLKHLKDTEPFLKSWKSYWWWVFTVESMTAARPPYSLSFRHLKDINQCNWDIEKGI